jgi:hypothetical protein
MRESMNIRDRIISRTFTATTALLRELQLVSAFQARARPQPARLVGQLAVRARLDRPHKVPHLRQALRRSRQSHLLSESHPPAERHRLRAQQQRDLALPHHGEKTKALNRNLRREKSRAQEAGQGKPSLRAAKTGKIAARESGRSKQNLPVAVLNFRENPLLEQKGNLLLKQQIPVKGPRKEHKHGLIGNQKSVKPIHLRQEIRNKGMRSVV